MRRLPLSTIVAAVLLVHAPLARAGQVFVDVGGATLRFTPANVSVLDHGDIIVWHWLNGGHTVTSGVIQSVAGDGNFNSSTLGSLQVANTFFSWKVGPLSYSYFCQPHFGFGMKGTINFQGAGAQVADLRLTEVRYDGVGSNFVEIANLGDVKADLNGFRLVINGVNVITLSAAAMVPLARQVIINPAGLTTSGSVALYAPHNIPSNAIPTAALTDTLMVDYVEWGPSGGQPLEAVANLTANPNLWTAGTFVPQVPAGRSMEFCGRRHQYGSAHWFASNTPSPGTPDDCSTPTTPTTWGRIKTLYR